MAPEDASPADIERLRAQFGLDRSLPVQYWLFLSHAVVGNFGVSFKYDEPVLQAIAEHLPATIELAFTATLFAALIGVPLGIWAGAKPNSWLDNAASVIGFFGISLPGFWMGIMLILITLPTSPASF
eukprot:gene1466-1487_t